MQALVLGIAKLDFKSSTGDLIQGTQLFYGFTAENTVGYKTDKVFIQKSIPLPENLQPNSTINLYFDRKGKVEAVTLAK